MQKRLTTDEAHQILGKLVLLRKRAKKNSALTPQYKKYESYCGEVFDYIVRDHTSRYRAFDNYEDLKQDARMALLHALRSFDQKKGNWFSWANKYIITRVRRVANQFSSFHVPIKHIKEFKPHKVSMPIFFDGGADPAEVAESKEINSLVMLAINNLPNDQQKIIELNGIKQHSISKISKQLNLSRKEVLDLLGKARETLRSSLVELF